ncbi:MAG: GDP-mannose 4,6-dehydratase [Candidatus Omnitrophica bacterium]|nr:GDP-mannose 4,6-dehydratase [Candidatus Omnitrophota bacterium]
MSTQPVVVIGSNCFTGSHFVDALLQAGVRPVVGISRSPEARSMYLPYKARDQQGFNFYRMDLVRQPQALETLLDELEPATVINVAALSEVALSNHRPLEYFETNTLGVVRLCHFLRTRPYFKRYVHISSAEIYGPCPHPVSETDPFRPSTPYAVSKAAADLYLSTLVSNFGFPAVTVRSTNVYGKHQQLFKIIPRTIIRIKQNRKIQLHGGGHAVKSFVHIRDVVRGGLEAMRVGEPGGVYHFSTQSDLTVAGIVRKLGELMGKSFEEIAETVGERLGQDSRYWLDCTKAQRELGWRPEVDFEDGLRETIAWIEQSWDQIVQEPLEYAHKA